MRKRDPLLGPIEVKAVCRSCGDLIELYDENRYDPKTLSYDAVMLSRKHCEECWREIVLGEVDVSKENPNAGLDAQPENQRTGRGRTAS